ncbi:CRISPR-associated CARF protein Csa3 [Natronorubrum aibiense]|uniref:CRISPR locus-related DNA-binding protein n=1 Tax=Natronorubrum aibiense TaxID=348826 RepID=A0A5P9P8Q6_9EURY|nr:CRISPR-associated CARF protein Csa3 [Natronorubrum aibiense]QFU84270.1 CRISPR locus-related DNA-binding protein [Natronorubrum aibiense]
MARMTTFIATIGFDSTRVTRPVLTYGLEEGDEIVLVQPADDGENDRSNEAREDVRRMVTELQPNVTVDSVALDPEKFYEGIRQSIDRIKSESDDVVLVLGGGARDIYLPVSFSAFLARDEIHTVLQFSDITGSVSEIQIPNFVDPLGDSVVETLEAIVDADEETSLTFISNTLDVAKSTVARHVSELEERGFVRSEKHGKSKMVYPTEEGRLAIDINVF